MDNKNTQKAAMRPGPRADKVDGDSAVLAAIAAMPEPSRAIGERLHKIIKAGATSLLPRLWYGLPAFALTELTAAKEQTIGALVRKAVS